MNLVIFFKNTKAKKMNEFKHVKASSSYFPPLAWSSISPAVPVPQQQADVVDDGGLAQFDLDPGPAVLLDGVSGEAVVQVVVLRVSVQQRRFQLSLHHLGAVLHGGDVFFRD